MLGCKYVERNFFGAIRARHVPLLVPGGRPLISQIGFPLHRTCFSTTRANSRKVVFSGIQPTGVPHLGNYLGALREWVRIQDEAEDDTILIFSLVDLHAITIRQNPGQLRQWKRSSLAMLLAIGLDPQRCIIFHQSDVPSHTELMWILSCFASTGRLSRMTQWKDKTQGSSNNNNNNDKDSQERLKLGLFSYPVLQAADVLLYRATHVPVGHDQAQHLEFARDLADAFHHFFPSHLHPPSPSSSPPHATARILPPPSTLLSPAKRIMSLTRPVTKMSKSDPDPRSRILLTDARDVIHAKFRAAVTDSLPGIEYRPDLRPGVSNLIDILYHVTDDGGSELDREDDDVVVAGKVALAQERAGWSLRALKEEVADGVDQILQPVRERYTELMRDGREDELSAVAERGAALARVRAEETMMEVKRAVGLL